MGAQGPPGKDGPAGKAGDKGPAGDVGPRGIGIKTINISESAGNANLTVTLTDDTVIPLGNVRGPKGDTGAVTWSAITDPAEQARLAALLGDITAQLNTKASEIFANTNSSSQFQSQLKSFILARLNEDVRSNTSDFKNWLNTYQQNVSLYCANGICESPDKNITLGYYGPDGNGVYDKEVRLSTRKGTGDPSFGLGIKDGNVRTDGDITLKSGKSVYTTFIRPVDNSGITLAGNTTVDGALTANNIQLPNGWAIATDNDSLNILRGGDVKLAVHNEGKIWAKTGYGVHGSNWLYSARTDGVLGPADVGTWGDNNRGNNTKWFVNQ